MSTCYDIPDTTHTCHTCASHDDCEAHHNNTAPDAGECSMWTPTATTITALLGIFGNPSPTTEDWTGDWVVLSRPGRRPVFVRASAIEAIEDDTATSCTVILANGRAYTCEGDAREYTMIADEATRAAEGR